MLQYLRLGGKQKNYYSFPQPLASRTDTASSSMCKAIPLQVWTDPEGSGRLGLSDFKTIDT